MLLCFKHALPIRSLGDKNLQNFIVGDDGNRFSIFVKLSVFKQIFLGTSVSQRENKPDTS